MPCHPGPRPPTPVHEATDTREFVHRIDAEDRICSVNESWLAFATENGWDISADQVLGTRLMASISDAETRHIYRLLIDRARAGTQPVRFRYRCDSPELRRFMEMALTRAPGNQVEFRSRVLRLERREPVAVLDPAVVKRGGDPLQICSWCKAVYAQAAWLKLEEAIQTLDVLAETVLPGLSHGICPSCSERMTRLGGAQ